jgi:DNA invertase Pin-like site-specific DNA recombinase
MAHRVSYETNVGPIPAGHVIRHTCDNPPCINPAHLVTGTQRDNEQDKTDRGRRPLGSATAQAKLSERDVGIIRLRLSQGLTQDKIAAEFSVSRSLIYRIAKGAIWKGIAPATRARAEQIGEN